MIGISAGKLIRFLIILVRFQSILMSVLYTVVILVAGVEISVVTNGCWPIDIDQDAFFGIMNYAYLHVQNWVIAKFKWGNILIAPFEFYSQKNVHTNVRLDVRIL